MTRDPSISLENVSVEIPLFSAPQHRSLKQKALNFGTGGRFAVGINQVPRIVALDNISLEIPVGTRLGLLGHNGAGKTTLLRVIAGILKPNSGTVNVQGRTSVFISPAMGSNPEITGREFITVQSLIAGNSPVLIEENMEDIIVFTELGDYIDLPIRTYSSGMQTRLSFAIATAYQSEIVLIDEGLGAGDQAFQKKAAARFDEWLGKAGIVVLASHSEPLIDSICNKTIRLTHGQLEEI